MRRKTTFILGKRKPANKPCFYIWEKYLKHKNYSSVENFEKSHAVSFLNYFLFFLLTPLLLFPLHSLFDIIFVILYFEVGFDCQLEIKIWIIYEYISTV